MVVMCTQTQRGQVRYSRIRPGGAHTIPRQGTHGDHRAPSRTVRCAAPHGDAVASALVRVATTVALCAIFGESEDTAGAGLDHGWDPETHGTIQPTCAYTAISKVAATPENWHAVVKEQ